MKQNRWLFTFCFIIILHLLCGKIDGLSCETIFDCQFLASDGFFSDCVDTECVCDSKYFGDNCDLRKIIPNIRNVGPTYDFYGGDSIDTCFFSNTMSPQPVMSKNIQFNDVTTDAYHSVITRLPVLTPGVSISGFRIFGTFFNKFGEIEEESSYDVLPHGFNVTSSEIEDWIKDNPLPMPESWKLILVQEASVPTIELKNFEDAIPDNNIMIETTCQIMPGFPKYDSTFILSHSPIQNVHTFAIDCQVETPIQWPETNFLYYGIIADWGDSEMTEDSFWCWTVEGDYAVHSPSDSWRVESMLIEEHDPIAFWEPLTKIVYTWGAFGMSMSGGIITYCDDDGDCNMGQCVLSQCVCNDSYYGELCHKKTCLGFDKTISDCHGTPGTSYKLFDDDSECYEAPLAPVLYHKDFNQKNAKNHPFSKHGFVPKNFGSNGLTLSPFNSICECYENVKRVPGYPMFCLDACRNDFGCSSRGTCTNNGACVDCLPGFMGPHCGDSIRDLVYLDPVNLDIEISTRKWYNYTYFESVVNDDNYQGFVFDIPKGKTDSPLYYFDMFIAFQDHSTDSYWQEDFSYSAIHQEPTKNIADGSFIDDGLTIGVFSFKFYEEVSKVDNTLNLNLMEYNPVADNMLYCIIQNPEDHSYGRVDNIVRSYKYTNAEVFPAKYIHVFKQRCVFPVPVLLTNKKHWVEPQALITLDLSEPGRALNPSFIFIDNQANEFSEDIVYFKSGDGNWIAPVLTEIKGGSINGLVDPLTPLPAISITGVCDGENCINGVCTVSGDCLCYTGYFGEHCDSTCDSNITCSGNGICNIGLQCTCDDNWFGLDCSVECDPAITCSGNGICSLDGSCDCNDDFYGDECQHYCVDTLNCSGNGVCNNEGGCDCDISYVGDDCSVGCNATVVCSGNGACTEDGLGCICEDDYFTDDCSVHCITGVDCLGLGSVCNTEDGTCNCGESLYGEDCSITCTNSGTCNTHGICTEDGLGCVCNEYWYGEYCTQYCHNITTCNGQGYCNSTGGCVCDEGDYGEHCLDPCNATIHCSGHGVCDLELDLCACDSDYDYLPDCSIYCNDTVTCSGNGICGVDGDVCICDDYHVGNDCSIECHDAEDCGDYGICDNSGDCECDSGWFGPACSCNVDVNCSSNGVCDEITAECVCNEFYNYTDDCSIYCEPEVACNNHGSCSSNGSSCECDMGWNGDSCQCNSVDTCSGNGVCAEDGLSCVCDPHFYLDDCSEECTSLVNCNNNGVCVENNGSVECTCLSGFFGPSCGCSPEDTCSGNGECIDESDDCVCDPDYNGNDCSVYCNDAINCSSNGMCSEDGTSCECDLDWVGPDCQCHEEFTCSGLGTCEGLTGLCSCPEFYTYADDCSVYCDPSVTCNGNGGCDVNGSCECDVPWAGNECDCNSLTTCGIHGSCDVETGDCNCDLYHYGDDCTMYCNPFDTCSNHGDCLVNGTACVCDDNYFGDDCDTFCDSSVLCSGNGVCFEDGLSCVCDDTYFTDDCSVECIPETTCSSNGICDGITGLCVCNETLQYYGIDCSVYCNDTVTCNGDGVCNVETGACDCNDDYFADDCSVNCVAAVTCNDHGVCDAETGACVCIAGYFGDDCGDICTRETTCLNHGNCSEDGLSCICDTYYFGDNCTTYCEVNATCSNRGICAEDGMSCICDENYLGDDCSVYCDPIITCNGDGICSEDGLSCVCNEFYDYEDDCSVYCEANVTCNGNGVCSEDGLSCVCNEFYEYENDCSVYCDSSVSCHGNGVCDLDGVCNCSELYYGNTCDTYCNAIITCTNQGTCNLNDGTCDCDLYWLGDNCALEFHSVKTTVPDKNQKITITIISLFSITLIVLLLTSVFMK